MHNRQKRSQARTSARKAPQDPDLPTPRVRTDDFYVIPEAGDSITCQCCGFTSRDPVHVREKYCPRCLVFHEDRSLMNRLSQGLDTQLPIKNRWPEPHWLRTVQRFAE